MEVDTKSTVNDCLNTPGRLDDERVRVVIVGAGVSGLRCAHQLVHRYGLQPTQIRILEARNRIGGRVHSEAIKRKDVRGTEVEFVVDYGAAWVHGTGYDWGVDPHSTDPYPFSNPVMELLQQGTPQGSVYEHHLVRICNGNPWMRPHFALHAENQLAIYMAGEVVSNADPVIELALKRHFDTLAAVAEYGKAFFYKGQGLDTVQITLADAIQAVQEQVDAGLPEANTITTNRAIAISKLYQLLIECWYGTDTSSIQLSEFSGQDGFEDDHCSMEELPISFPDTKYTDEGDFFGPHCTLRHGMQCVWNPLLGGGIREQVELNQQVTRITRTDDQTIRIETSSGMVVNTESCVITIPAGCLKEAASSGTMFATSLSTEKMEAIDLLAMGCYKKVFLTFNRIFWSAEPAFLAMIRNVTNDIGNHSESVLGNHLLLNNLWARRGIPCVEALLFGSAGKWAAYKPTEAIRDAVLTFMDDAMKLSEEVRELCTDCHVTRWEEDPCSRGAYSFLGVGAHLLHVDELKRPEWDGRLVFSGEATISEMEGSVYSAIFSGDNAAEKVHLVLSGDTIDF